MKKIYSPAIKEESKPAGAECAHDERDEDWAPLPDQTEQSDWMITIRNLSEDVHDPWRE